MPPQPAIDGSARQIFDQALERPEVDRQGFVRSTCGADEALRKQVEELLAAYQAAEAAFPEPTSGELAGDRIGPYKLLEKIGEGGFGTVWMAEQHEPLRRRVALKILKWGMDTRAVVARFEAERQALALMDHPHIARVFDAGATANGRPYFVMELVRGVPITRYCDEARLSPRERLELFQRVCEAVQHAHQKGIIHRDLKPGNVLVTLQDGRPMPKVIDFGIAKATSGQLTEKTVFTGFLQVLGTPEYMAPEQAEMTGIDVDTRADVYSLGVLLYELLTGTRPFELTQMVPLGFQELLRRIREVEPEKPSTRISTLGERLLEVCGRRRVQPRAFARLLHGDLDWIVLKALEKERGRRYATAESFAADIGRHLRDEPVEAGPPSRLYRLRKHLRRHWVGAMAAASVALAICGGSVLSWLGYAEAVEQEALASAAATRANKESQAALLAREEESEQRRLAEEREAEARREALRAERVVELLRSMVRGSDPHETKGPDYTLRELLEDLDRGLAQELADEPAVEASLREVMAESFLGLGLPSRAERHVTRALELRERVSGATSAAMADALELRAQLLHDQSRYRSAADVMERALAILESQDDVTAEHQAGLLGLMTDYVRHQGDFTRAEAFARRAVDLARTSPDPEQRFLSGAQHSLCMVLLSSGRPAEAEALLREGIELATRSFGEDSQQVAHWLVALSFALGAQGKQEEAEATSLRAYELSRSYGISANPVLVSAAKNRANLLGYQGEWAESEKVLREAIAGGREGGAALELRRELAVVLVNLGRAREAETIQRQELERLRAAAEPDPEALRAWLNNLAINLDRQERLQEAEVFYREALELGKQAHDEDFLRLLYELQGETQVLVNLKRWEEAEPLALELVDVARTISNGEHLYYPVSLTLLGMALHNLGRLDEAERAYQEAQALWERLPDGEAVRAADVANNHHYRVGTRFGAARLLEERGRPVEAAAQLEAAMARETEFHGEASPEVDMARTKLGKVWVEQERYEEAKSLLQPARSRTLQGAESPVHAACLHWLALAFMGQERWAEAEPLLSEALDLFRRLKGEADPATEECESDLVRLLIGLDWPADAADLARAQLERRRGRLAEDDPLIADTLALLGRAQLAGAPASAEAEATLRQCLELRTRKAPESWETREASTLLGSCLLAQGRQTEAEPLLRKGAEPLPSAATLAMRRAHREGLLGIARWCEAVGRPEEAKTWREKRAAVEPAQVR